MKILISAHNAERIYRVMAATGKSATAIVNDILHRTEIIIPPEKKISITMDKTIKIQKKG